MTYIAKRATIENQNYFKLNFAVSKIVLTFGVSQTTNSNKL